MFLHDCVIIPDFGGFVTNYAPAKINAIQHTLTPPSKKLAFNKKLQNNDGLLATYISNQENISYTEALKQVQAAVDIFNTILNDGKRLTIQLVGELFYDAEKNLQFEADERTNFLLDSFGMIAVQSPAIKREDIQKRLEKQFKDRPSIASPARKKFPWKVLIPVPFVALAIVGSVYFNVFSTLNISANSLNPFASAKVEVPVVKPVLAAPEQVEIPVAVTEATPVVVQPAPVVEAAPEAAIAEAASAPVNVATDYSYYVVAGCFREEANANNMLRQLQEKGFSAMIKGRNAGGLIVVCYGAYTSREEATGALAKAQSESDKNAWLLSN